MNVKVQLFFRRTSAVCVSLAALCLIGLVYSSTFRSKQPTAPPSNLSPAIGVAEIDKPFSYASVQTVTVPKVVILSAENLSSGHDEESVNSFAEQEAAAGFGNKDSQAWRLSNPRANSRQGMIYLLQSQPAFGLPKAGGSAVTARQMLAASAAQYLDTPFSSLFSSVFKHGSEEGMLAADALRPKDPTANPFSEAKQKAEAEAPAPAPSTPKETPPPADQSAKSTPSAPITAPKSKPFDGPYTFVGDFNGDGTLTAMSANRVDDGTFVFADGKRTFSLFINPATVESQRSFAVDDFSGDEVADLVVTSRSALFGAVMLGDGQGDFQLADTFVTGYEPTVALAGLLQGTQRDILSVDMRSGAVTTFRKQEHYDRVLGQNLISFLPDFVARVTETAATPDCFLAAQAGKAVQAYQWQDDGSLSPSDDRIPSNPSISVYKDFLQEGATGVLQVYQVGSNASALLTTSHGQSFNVANFRVFPKIFLAVGSLTKGGTLDVAVAYLLSTTPSN